MNRLYYGDNLSVLRGCVDDASVDLIYLDPPFNSQATYNVLFKSTAGEKSRAQIEAFEDTWHWGDEAELAFDGVMSGGNSAVAEMLRAMRSFLRENDMMAYLSMMAVRLLELHRILKPSGSMYLHCDPSASHYLKILIDSVFGGSNLRNEIIWKRTSGRKGVSQFGRVHDVILFYSKSEKSTWNPPTTPQDESNVRGHDIMKDSEDNPFRVSDFSGAGEGPARRFGGKTIDPPLGRHWMFDQRGVDRLMADERIIFSAKGQPRLKTYLEDLPGISIHDVWTDIEPINSAAQERLGYPTQKPLALLERIIGSSSNQGDVVLDPFCGCGTAIHAAQKLRREWIGIDITHLAISLIEKRLKDAFPGIKYEVHGTPKDLDGARDLAARDKYQFQWWAVSLVNAVPFAGKKKGADSGIDGLIYFKPEGKVTEKAIVSVKGGENVNVAMVRDLAHVVDRENARIGVFITLADSTGPMRTEAVKAGYYETLYGRYPKIQILTIRELFEGKQPNIPLVDSSAFKKAPKESQGDQGHLPL
jgi:site-specific DNA-methyltransferase (adenine-specific)